MICKNFSWYCMPVVFAWFAAGYAHAESPYILAWGHQIASVRHQRYYDLSLDGLGNLYIGGAMERDIEERPEILYDALVAKYRTDGTLMWTRQLGSVRKDEACGIDADALGNVYIGGRTFGNLAGSKIGASDAFLAKYDAEGNFLWARQWGSRWDDVVYDVCADGLGNVYVSGFACGEFGGGRTWPSNAMLAKYDTSGTLLWVRQLESPANHEEQGLGVAVDGLGDVYMAGWTWGNLAGPSAGNKDAFLAKYTSNGERLWVRQFGTSGYDQARGVWADSAGNAYVMGYTTGSLVGQNKGSYDIFVGKYDPEGRLLWMDQIGSTSYDCPHAISGDGFGALYVAGMAGGDLAGQDGGGNDIFLAKYTEDGSLGWVMQIGTRFTEVAYGVGADSPGNVYLAGVGDGALFEPDGDDYEVFVARYAVPEPSTFALLPWALLGLGLCAVWHRRQCAGRHSRA